MGIDWSELPPELLEVIANKLKIYAAYVRFRAICGKFRSSVSPRPHHLPTQFPWLVFSFKTHDLNHNITCYLFFDILANKYHCLNLFENLQSRCCGCSQGWLVLAEENSPVIFVVNPLTRLLIRLPPVTTFPNALDFKYFKLGEEYVLRTSNGDRYLRDVISIRDSFIKKVVLSPSPDSIETDYIALAMLNDSGDIAYCKKGDEEWSLIEDAESYCEDAIYFNGSFYAVNQEGSIAICDLNGVDPDVTLVTPPPLVGHDVVYLVDAFGDLLLVTRNIVRVFTGGPKIVYKTIDFGVYKFDSSKPEWVQMDTLGDRTLFLGGNSSACLDANDYSGCEKNCIYFTDEGLDRGDGSDLGVYRLDDCSIVPMPYGGGRPLSFLPPPIWFTPNPC